MAKIVILMTVFLISISINAQDSIKKILLNEGTMSDIKHRELTLSTFLHEYNEKSEAHLIGDLYLRVDNEHGTIAQFYVDKNNDKSTIEYYTKIHKNYFLTFKIENNDKYLIIEQAQFGKPFALSSKESALIGNENNIEIEIADYIYEWGDDTPPEDKNMSCYDDVKYTLKVKENDIVKKLSFYSSDIKGNYIIELINFSIIILSDKHEHSSVLIEMIMNKKEE